MLDLLDQTKAAVAAKAYMPALMAALTVPDVCGALGSENGRASGSKYKSWLVEWFETNGGTPHARAITQEEAKELYAFRCSLLHQGSAYPDGRSSRLAFIEPGPGRPHLHNLSTEVNGEIVGWISIPLFIDEMVHATSAWWAVFGGTATVVRNLERYVRRRPDGLPPHVAGAPVIA